MSHDQAFQLKTIRPDYHERFLVLSIWSYIAMVDAYCYVYTLDDSLDVYETHVLDFIRKYHDEVCLLTQTVDSSP